LNCSDIWEDGLFRRTKVLLTIVLSAVAPPLAAQTLAPTTTAFDGTYAGISRDVSKSPSAPRAKCPPSGALAPLTIKNGVVVSRPAAWEGTVSPQGVLIMRNERSVRVDGQIDPQGTIRAQYSGTGCITSFVWQKKGT
jgi:hypothetical protein